MEAKKNFCSDTDDLVGKGGVSAMSQDRKSISYTLNEKGAIILARELARCILEEKECEASLDNTEALLSKKEVMDLLGVSSTTLWNWCREKYLIPVKIGRKICYRQCDIEKLRKGE